MRTHLLYCGTFKVGFIAPSIEHDGQLDEHSTIEILNEESIIEVMRKNCSYYDGIAKLFELMYITKDKV